MLIRGNRVFSDRAENLGGAVMKTLSIFLALLNPLMAWVSLSVTITDYMNPGPMFWLQQMIVGILIVALAVFTLWGGMQSVHAKVIMLVELFLILSGEGNIVWGVQFSNGLLILYGGSLLAQGVAAVGSLGNAATS